MSPRHAPLSRRWFLLSTLAACAVEGVSRVFGAHVSKRDVRPLPARVLHTARRELALALAGHPPLRAINLDLFSTSAHAPLVGEQHAAFLGTPDSLDRYVVQLSDGTLHLFGSTPRGVLHAVFALREALVAGTPLTDDFVLQGTFHFRERIFHARFDRWPGTRPDVRFLAHLGATHCLVSHDWQGSRRSLQGYVTSPIFPHAVPSAEVTSNHAGLRHLLDACADYGLGAMLWLTELPCQGGPWLSAEERASFLARFPTDVLSESGTNEGKVLCFSHPRVQEFYRDLIARFFADFPEIETLFLFGLDSGGEFCDPALCPRCRGMSRFAQRDRLLNFFIEHGSRVRPGLRVLTTGWGWDDDIDAFVRHQSALPAASGVYYAAQKDGWQCERQTHDALRAVRAVCRERRQTFIGYDNLLWGDDTVHGLGDIQDFPLGIGAKLKRWHALDADGIFDHWGGKPEELWSNAVACRDFFLTPTAEPDAIARQIALRQFGPVAGEHVLASWSALETAHATLSPACTWAPLQWPGWYAGRKQFPLPGHFRSAELIHSQRPPRRDGEHFYNPANFADALNAVSLAWREASPHYTRAAQHLRAAVANADDAPLFYQFWWSGPEKSPTRREHLRRQLLYIESVGAAGHEIGLHFGLHGLWEQVGHDASAYRRAADSMLRADAEACRSAATLFARFGRPKDWAALYAAKAAAIDAFLISTPAG